MKKSKRFLSSLLLILSIVAGLFVVEIGMRIAKIEHPIFQTFDTHRGFSLRPNASGWWLREGKAYVKINSDGLRDREHDKKKINNYFRIAILGDSFAEARSIQLEKTFWFLMEEKLNGCKNNKYKKIETINFGVTEYGTTQELLTLQHKVWNYDPDIILLAFFSGNDVADNSKLLSKKKYRPYFIYRDDKIVVDNSFRNSKPYLLLKSNIGQLAIKMSDYSRIVQFLRESYVKYYFKKISNEKKINNQNNKKIVEPGINYKQLYDPSTPVWQEAWKVTESIIKLMNDDIIKKKKNFVVVTLSNSLQVHPDIVYQEMMKEKFGINDLFYPDKRIKKLGDDEGFLVINLAEKMQKYAEQTNSFLHGFDNTFLGEGHWNEQGHKIASEIISEKICHHLMFF